MTSRLSHLLCTSLLLACATTAAAIEELSGWQRSDAKFDRSRITALDAAIANDEFRHINSIVVIKGGRLLVERYYNGADRNSTHNPRSVGKTFAAAVLGIAIEQGYIEGVNQTLGDFYDLEKYKNFSASKNDVTLQQLINMSSGFEGYDFDPESPGNEELMYPQPDWVEWTLNRPMSDSRQPGDEWRYFTAGIVLVGDILNRSVPGGLESYAHQVLFARLGISNYEWQHTPQRVANTAGGVQLTPLDFAKFGELHRQRGQWHGATIMPQEWVEASLRPALETTVPGNRYSNLWWHKSYGVGGEDWPTAYCTGNGGNKIFVFDDQQLVVVITASAYGQSYAHSQVDRMMSEYILPAVASH